MNEVISKVNEFDPYAKSISISLLLNNESKLSNHEKRMIHDKEIRETKSDFFKNGIIEYYKNNFEDFPLISSTLSSESLMKNEFNLDDYLIENELELFFPYMENFDNYEENYTITFEDGNEESIHEGYMFNPNNQEYISGIDEDYLFDNPTIAIIPIDEDYIGEMLMITDCGGNHQYLDPNQPIDQLMEFYGDLYSQNSCQQPIVIGPIYGGGGGPTNPQPPQRIRIAQNINPYTFFGDNDVLTNFLPKARITTTSWKRTLSKAHRTRIARAGTTIGINPNGELSAVTGVFYFDFDISASDLRNKRWKTLNIMFDPNWHKAKGSQQIVVWTKRRNSSTSTVNVKNEIKIDGEGNYTPTTSLSVNVTAGSGSKAIFRGNSELDRDQVLTTIVGGSEYDNSTINHNNLNLSVRRVAQKFEYFFDFYYTSL
ncbi:hypothetical protein [Psychroflexus montanilacus]|uniref:hypothetical protein n=1 Tax=Psychroflexus montanilacus TaxID=2873598 RepID=UPI001CCEB17A|nr:hypothetical protein [Psychroflexus montanilacus]MBZ9652233.1 hypothetical protein [Psychroflexus montanilacus]